MDTTKKRKGGRPFFRLAIVALALVCALIAITIVAAPKIVSKIASQRLARLVESSIGGTAKALVRVRWASPATIESLVVKDESGRTIVDVSVATEISMLDALRFDGQAGTVTITGSVVLTPGMLNTQSSAKATDGGASGASSGNDLSALSELVGAVEFVSLALTLEDEDGEIFSTDDLNAGLALDRGSVSLIVKTESPIFELSASGSDLFTSDGALAYHSMTANAELDTVPDRALVERVLSIFGISAHSEDRTLTILNASSSGDRVVLRYSASLADGRLEIAPKGGPSSVPMPDAVLALFVQEGDERLSLQTRPAVSIDLKKFGVDIMPDGGGLIDPSSGSLVAELTLTPSTISLDRGTERSRIELTPVVMNITSGNFAERTEFSASTSVSLDGQPTQRLAITGSISNPLTPDLRFNPESRKSIRAYFDGDRVPSSLLEPLFAQSPYSANSLFGRFLQDITASIESAEGGGPFGDVRITLTAKGAETATTAELDVLVDLIRRDDMIVSDEETAIKIHTTRVGTLLKPWIPEGITIRGEGVGAIGLVEPRIALRDGFAPDLSRSEGEFRLIVGELVAEIQEPALGPVTLSSIDSRISIWPDKPAEILLDYRLEYQRQVFDLFARSTIDGLDLPQNIGDLKDIDLSAITARVLAKLSDVPTSLLNNAWPDLADAAAQLAGEALTFTVRPDEREGALVHTLEIETDTGRLEGGLVIDVRDGEVVLRDTRLTGVLTPLAFDRLISIYAPGAGGEAFALDEAEPYTLTASDVRVQLRDGLVPDLSTLRRVSAGIAFDDAVVLRGIERPDKPGQYFDAGVRDFLVRYRHDTKDALRREVNTSGSLFDPNVPGAPALVTFRGLSGITSIANLELSLSDISPAGLDTLLSTGGILEQALGATAGAEFQIKDQTNPNGRSYYLSFGSERVRSFRASLLDTGGVAGVGGGGGGLGLVEPITAVWDIPSSLIESYARLEDAETGENRLRVTELSPVNIRVDRLVLGPAGNRLDPAAIELDAQLGSRRIAFSIDGSPEVVFENILAKIAPANGLDALAFDVSAAQPQAEDEPKNVLASGTLSGLKDKDIKISMNASGDVPTMLIDAFARSNGAVYDLLGPTATIDLRATDLSRDSGHAALSVEAEHVRGAIEGDAKQGVFHAADGARITVMHISKDISERYIETVLPFLTRFEKTAQDDPAEFTADGLTIPLGNDMTKLNGRVRMDLGTVQFSTSTLFGDILDATNNNRTGSLGGRVDPILLTIDKGVLSYERTKIPTGSYVMETRGTIDLVKQKMEIILYLPLSALSKDLRNAFGRVPGLDDFGLVPIRIKGALNKPKIEPALDLVLEEGVPELIDRVLEDVLKDTLDDLFNPGKNNR